MIITYTFVDDSELYRMSIDLLDFDKADSVVKLLEDNPKVDSYNIVLTEREKKIKAILEKRSISEIIAELPETVQNRLENYRLRIAHYRNVASGATMDAVALTAEASAYIQGLHDMGILTDRQRQAIYTYTVV